jgi:microcystin-dependent protein
MSSTMRRTGHRSAVERPMVGDTKTSMVRDDHLGWLRCDGRQLLKTEYTLLYAVLGDDFGDASAGYFRLPDAMGRVVGLIGQADPSSTVWVDGSVSGEETHTLTIAEMPTHRHGTVDETDGDDGDGLTGVNGEHTHDICGNGTDDQNFTAGGAAVPPNDVPSSSSYNVNYIIKPAGAHQHTIGRTGGDQPHNNMQPTIFLGNLFIFCGRPSHNTFTSSPTSFFPPRVASRLY